MRLALFDDDGEEIVDWPDIESMPSKKVQTIGHTILSNIGEVLAAREPVLRLDPLQQFLGRCDHADLMRWMYVYNEYVMNFHDREDAGRGGNWPVCFLEFVQSQEGAEMLKEMYGK